MPSDRRLWPWDQKSFLTQKARSQVRWCQIKKMHSVKCPWLGTKTSVTGQYDPFSFRGDMCFFPQVLQFVLKSNFSLPPSPSHSPFSSAFSFSQDKVRNRPEQGLKIGTVSANPESMSKLNIQHEAWKLSQVYVIVVNFSCLNVFQLLISYLRVFFSS